MKPEQITRNACIATPPEGLVDISARAYVADGTIYLPACEVAAGTSTRSEDDAMLVQLEMAAASMIGNRMGMFVRFTPEGARLIARRLLDNATRVEAHVAAQAEAAIEKARKAGTSGEGETR